jgi:trans-aconitate methyltransferase
MITLAQEFYAEIKNMFFQQANATDFSYSEEFDVVFSNAVLHWVKDHVAVLENCYRGLRRGGKVLLQMGGKGNAQEFIDVVTDVTRKEKWKNYFKHFIFPFSFYTTQNYETWLKNAGFKSNRIELIHKDMQHTGAEGLAGWFRTSWMPYTGKLPENQREEFIHDVVETYLKTHPVDNAGKTHVTMVRLEVEAV